MIRVGDIDIEYAVSDYTDPWRDDEPETILFHHGYCRNMEFWRNWVPGLASHYRVLRFNSRGCGNTTAPPAGTPYRAEDLVGDAFGLMDKLGIERRLLTAGENKGLLDPFSPLNKAQRAHAQSMLDQIHRQFIAVVREGRGDRLHETTDMFSGLFWTGEQAVKLGLADELANLATVARDVVKAQDIIDYTRRENVAEKLAKRFGAAMGEGAVRALRAIGTWH